jgi:excisionase family DNA binding protein
MADVHQLRPEPEPYLTRRELAGRLHIGLTKLDELVKDGMPSHTWGMRIRRFRYSECERWLRQRERVAA